MKGDTGTPFGATKKKEGDLLYSCSDVIPSQPSARIGWDAKTNNAPDSQEGSSRMLKGPGGEIKAQFWETSR